MHAGDYGEDNITRCQPGEISWNIRRDTCNVKDESRRFILGLQLLLLRQLPLSLEPLCWLLVLTRSI